MPPVPVSVNKCTSVRRKREQITATSCSRPIRGVPCTGRFCLFPFSGSAEKGKAKVWGKRACFLSSTAAVGKGDKPSSEEASETLVPNWFVKMAVKEGNRSRESSLALPRKD